MRENVFPPRIYPRAVLHDKSRRFLFEKVPRRIGEATERIQAPPLRRNRIEIFEVVFYGLLSVSNLPDFLRRAFETTINVNEMIRYPFVVHKKMLDAMFQRSERN